MGLQNLLPSLFIHSPLCVVVMNQCIRIHALQTLLLARSPVFAAMFAGDLAEKTDRPVIHIDDVEPHSFKEMLR